MKSSNSICNFPAGLIVAMQRHISPLARFRNFKLLKVETLLSQIGNALFLSAPFGKLPAVAVAASTVGDYPKRAELAGLSWPLPEEWTVILQVSRSAEFFVVHAP